MNISEIRDELGYRYQFCYQVIKRYCNKNDIEFPTNKNNKESKAAKIRKLYDSGMNMGEISKKLNTNYTYVWSVCDKHRKNNEE